MTPLPKARDFWDYALLTLAMTGGLTLRFWRDASDGATWADAALALAMAVFFVLGIILAPRDEKATWVARPTWHADLLGILGTIVLLFGAEYADSYLLHPRDITFKRFRSDAVIAIVVTAGMLWWLGRRRSASRQLL